MCRAAHRMVFPPLPAISGLRRPQRGRGASGAGAGVGGVGVVDEGLAGVVEQVDELVLPVVAGVDAEHAVGPPDLRSVAAAAQEVDLLVAPVVARLPAAL